MGANGRSLTHFGPSHFENWLSHVAETGEKEGVRLMLTTKRLLLVGVEVQFDGLTATQLQALWIVDVGMESHLRTEVRVIVTMATHAGQEVLVRPALVSQVKALPGIRDRFKVVVNGTEVRAGEKGLQSLTHCLSDQVIDVIDAASWL